MKSILLSIKPKYVAMILNGEKTLELRKFFPKDYVGWVYIYCTKDKKYANLINRGGFLTGMVVARFWCDKVKKYYNCGQWKDDKPDDILNLVCERACLTRDELDKYCEGQEFYAIHISKLEIFEIPKEISEFKQVKFYTDCKKCPYLNNEQHCDSLPNCHEHVSLIKAPQSRQYVEV